MDFIDRIRVIASRAETTIELLQTEEATKNALIMPMIQALGYDVFNPMEVMPELVADIGTKKGEKVDYAILNEGKPAIIFECKKAGGDLNINHASQLFRYFHVTAARFAVLTNGLNYRFFTDLEQPNVMDKQPFFEFNILSYKASDLDELKKFAKASYDLDNILNTANQLKYVRGVNAKLTELVANPSDEFVKLLVTDLLSGKRFTPAIKDQFATVVKQAIDQFIGEKINQRLKGAMTPETTSSNSIQSSPVEIEDKTKTETTQDPIVTTAQELEGFHSVKAILRETVDPKRITMRDAQSYCAVLLDDNNRKPLCRLMFNNSNRLRLAVFNKDKEVEVFDLSCVDDIFKYAEQLKATVLMYP
ncbi:type I restriction endonuclease [Limnohabitans sp.]|jgi:hypothetical protein|uniref:type I restriction endonuclease n=1 Tax=Limnohabitans sp. TaxID=1907725 RepID=UPI0026265FB8|nr:type I restriction endonuclease [Limnohabitans sp.]